MREEMYTQACDMAIPYGIEKKCLKKVFTSKHIRKDMQSVLKNQLYGEVSIIDTNHVREKIKENVIKQKGELNEKQYQSLDAYIVEVEKMYQRKMIIPGSNYIVKAINVSND